MKTTSKYHVVLTFLVLAMTTLAHDAAAADTAECTSCSLASDQELGTMRGGYVAGNGIEVLIGIKDAVFFNGVLQVANILNLPELGSALGPQLADHQELSKVVTVLTYGEGNSGVSPTLLNNLQAGRFTFIQNSLPNAIIRKVTEINASVTVLDIYQEMNLRSLMNQQLVNAVK